MWKDVEETAYFELGIYGFAEHSRLILQRADDDTNSISSLLCRIYSLCSAIWSCECDHLCFSQGWLYQLHPESKQWCRECSDLTFLLNEGFLKYISVL